LGLLIWLRELAATVGSIDRSSLEPGYALRCTIGVAVPLAIAAYLGEPALGVPAAIGAFITGFTSLQGIYRTRLTAVLAAAVGMSVTSFVGSLAAHSTLAIVAATAAAAFACATAGQIGPAASTVALNSFIAFLIFSSQALAPAAAAQESGLVFVGGLIQALLLLLAWPTARGRAERLALANVYQKLAEYAREVARGATAFPPITPLATARQVLADPQPFARAAEIARLSRLLEDAEIIRRRLGALAAEHASDGVGALPSGLASTAASQLDAIADALSGVRGDLQAPDFLAAGEAFKVAGIADLAAHLRDATEAASMLSRGRLPRFHLLSQPRPGPYVENHIEWRSRDALRFSLVMAIAMVLGRHFQADRGYWIPMTAALVLKPDFQTTFVRGTARIGGTLVGAVVASLVVAVARGHVSLQIAGILLAAGAAYLTFNPNYALFTVAITTFVVLVLAMRGLPGTTTIVARVLDTLAGGALAMIGYLTLPTWERKRTRALLGDLLDAQRRLAFAILGAYANPSSDARKAIDAARTDAWQVRTTAEASIDRTRYEPHRHHTIGAGRALRILAATQRFALASLALETALETQRSSQAAAQVASFADVLDGEMSELAQALRKSRRARRDARFAALSERLEAELDTQRDPARRFILERLLAYAEAATRIARLVGIEKTQTLSS
jgi:uncharacterized membrane protein YccC